MSSPTLLGQLRNDLSAQARVLTDPDDAEFVQLYLRWSDIDRKVPGAIIVAAEEADVVKAVKFAVQNNIPFVSCSGGHSLWSTIGEEGFILDLRQLDKIFVDVNSRQITLQSGVLVGKANEIAWEHGLCLPLGTANTAGVVPMAIGGGLNSLSSLVGSASDNIISAKIVIANGDLVNVSSTSHPDLFYGLRGAGQCFGVVTEITLQAHPKSILGTLDGTVWTGVMVFPITKADRVFDVLSGLSQNREVPTMGICIITSPPPSFATSLIVIPTFFGEATAAESFYQPLIQLEPFSTCTSIPFPRVNDAGEAFGIKGGLKRFAGAGIDTLDPKIWMQVAERYEKLKTEFPDASPTGYAVEWYGRGSPDEGQETAFSHGPCRMWGEFLSWYTDPASHDAVSLAEKEVIALVRKDQAPDKYRSYQNWTRDAPIEQLYIGKERLDRLKALKQKWDPAGVFTRLFLD